MENLIKEINPIKDGKAQICALLVQVYQMQGMFPDDDVLKETVKAAEDFLQADSDIHVLINDDPCDYEIYFSRENAQRYWDEHAAKDEDGDEYIDQDDIKWLVIGG